MLHATLTEAVDDGTSDVSADEWNEAHITPVTEVSGTSHTVASTDAGCTLRCTSSSATTVDVENLTVGQAVNILQAGTGAVTIAAGDGWTLVSRGSVFDLAGQWAVATVLCDDANHAVLMGDLE